MDFHRGILPYKQEDNMSLFRKKKWDIERSEQNKGLIRQLFSQAMPDGDTWKIVYGYGLNIKIKQVSNYPCKTGHFAAFLLD